VSIEKYIKINEIEKKQKGFGCFDESWNGKLVVLHKTG